MGTSHDPDFAVTAITTPKANERERLQSLKAIIEPLGLFAAII